MQLTAYKVWLLFLKIDFIRIIKNLLSLFGGVASWWKNASEGIKLGCWWNFLKLVMLYHSIRNLMLITKSIESRVWKFGRKKLQAQQSNLFNGFFYFSSNEFFFFLKSIHTNFCAKNWACYFYHTRFMETKIHTYA